MPASSRLAHFQSRIDPAASIGPSEPGGHATALLDSCARVGSGVVLLDHLGEVEAMNAEAAAVLATVAGRAERHPALAEPARDAVKALLARSARLLDPMADTWSWITREGGRPLLLHAIPMPRGGTALILIDLDQPPPPSRIAMEQVFGLTPAEARLTALLTGGASPSEAAAAQGVSLATVRKHLVSIFAKTRTRGQVELVALASRLAGLP